MPCYINIGLTKWFNTLVVCVICVKNINILFQNAKEPTNPFITEPEVLLDIVLKLLVEFTEIFTAICLLKV